MISMTLDTDNYDERESNTLKLFNNKSIDNCLQPWQEQTHYVPDMSSYGINWN